MPGNHPGIIFVKKGKTILTDVLNVYRIAPCRWIIRIRSYSLFIYIQ